MKVKVLSRDAREYERKYVSRLVIYELCAVSASFLSNLFSLMALAT